MDKRTLYFIVAMSLTLFGVNTFFAYMDQGRMAEWKKKEEAKQKQKDAELKSLIQEKSVSLSAIPLVDVESRKVLALDGFLFSIQEKDSLPETLNHNQTTYTLVSKKSEKGDLVAWKANQAGTAPLKRLPPVGTFELQLVSLDQDSSVVFAEYRSGIAEIPAFKFESPKSAHYLALYRQGNSWEVVGVYHAKDNFFANLSQFPDLSPLIQAKEEVADYKEAAGEENFYVLENSFQQLVFSTKGGSLAEINLPFKSETNQLSVVREVQSDRDILKDNPQNAYFPSGGFYTINEKGEKVHRDMGTLGGYYPLLRRSLIEKPPYETIVVPPNFYGANIISSKYDEVASLNYNVTKFTKDEIVFEAKQPHRRIVKRFRLPNESEKAPYVIDLNIEVEGDARNLYLTSAIPEVEWINGAIAPAIKSRMTRQGGKVTVESISLPSPDYRSSQPLDWVTNSNGFFGVILDPLFTHEVGFKAKKVAGDVVPSRLLVIDQEWERFKASKLPGYGVLLPLNKEGGKMHYRIFAGPFSTPILRQVDATFSDPETGYNPDYISSQSSHGWFTFISEPFSKFLMILMRFFHSLTGSWGFSIILLTLALRVMIYPLTQWSFKSMKKMQEVGPQIKKIQEKYKSDPKKMNLEMAALYREKGVNPVSGCLPFLIQLPFLFGMFDLLKTTFELRGAPFIPGWINDLSAPDIVFSWNYPIFFIGTEFHLLPILTALVMLLQIRFTQAKKDPSEMTEQERSQRSMTSLISLTFAFLFYNAPSGLCIYWIFSTLFGLVQQRWTNASADPKPVAAEVVPVEVSKKEKRKKKK